VPQVKCTSTCTLAAAGVKHGADQITAGSEIYTSLFRQAAAKKTIKAKNKKKTK